MLGASEEPNLGLYTLMTQLFLALVSLSFASSAHAAPIRYGFFQGGYDEGAFVSGASWTWVQPLPLSDGCERLARWIADINRPPTQTH
jgi:hypothetical protein